jgi:uncharacterized cupin superfamily protein
MSRADGELRPAYVKRRRGKWRIEYDEEFWHILSGVSVISEKVGDLQVRAGDSFVLRLFLAAGRLKQLARNM